MVAGCTEKPQTATARKVDATAYSGSTVPGYSAAGWKAGDKTSWEQGMKVRAQYGQNDHAR